MNEADLPAPENTPGDTAGQNLSQDARLPLIESAAQLSSALPSPPLAGDILHGAGAIAEFIYGESKSRRKVYHLVESANLPVFRLGANICARKSVLLEWISLQERVPQ